MDAGRADLLDLISSPTCSQNALLEMWLPYGRGIWNLVNRNVVHSFNIMHKHSTETLVFWSYRDIVIRVFTVDLGKQYSLPCICNNPVLAGTGNAIIDVGAGW